MHKYFPGSSAINRFSNLLIDEGGFMFRRIIKVIKTLNSNEAPWQISLGIIFGLSPLFSLHNLVVLLLALLIIMNIRRQGVIFKIYFP